MPDLDRRKRAVSMPRRAPPWVGERSRVRSQAAIAPDGTLMLGAGETVIGQTECFVSDPDHRGLYVPAPAHVASPAVSRVA